MSLVDVDSWITEYEACERLSHTILSQITQRDGIPKLTEQYSKLSSQIRIKLRQFDTELNQLKVKLDVSSHSGSITVEEIERRQRQIESLQSKYQLLQNRFKTVTTTDRDALLTSGGSSLWDSDDEAPILDTTSHTVQDLKQKQIQILEDQNRGLEQLSQTISRQKNLATRLGTEVVEHNEIIDNLADNMERMDTRIVTETQNITIIGRQDRTCGYWLVIGILFVLILVAAFV